MIIDGFSPPGPSTTGNGWRGTKLSGGRCCSLGFANRGQIVQQADPASQTNRYELLVQSVTDYAIYMLDPNGVITSWNAGAERLKGYTPDEIIGQHFSKFYTEENLQRRIPEIGLRTAAEEGRFEAHGWRVRKDGIQFGDAGSDAAEAGRTRAAWDGDRGVPGRVGFKRPPVCVCRQRRLVYVSLAAAGLFPVN